MAPSQVEKCCRMDDFVILIHGGAWDIPLSLSAAHRTGVLNAFDTAEKTLQNGGRPLDAVVAALESMENDETFDAGRGSFLNENGNVELDASVMEGESLRAGAVAGIGAFPNPSRIALAVLEKTEHVLLIGRGAEDFALRSGFHSVDPSALVLPREIAAYEAWIKAGKPDARVFFAKPTSESLAGAHPDKRGTVGVTIGVRKRETGRFELFAGTSTGGTPGKMAGRVGDVPLVGCGIYADNLGAAVSCTGWGEGLIRVAAAKAVSDAVKNGSHPQEAVEGVLHEMLQRTGGRGGIIAVDGAGRTGAAFTTPDMAFAGRRVVHLLHY